MADVGAADLPERTVLLADDEVGLRAGIKRALKGHGLTVVAEATTTEEAVSAALAHRPDVCLLAVELPGGGIKAAERINELVPETRIVILTGLHRDEDLFASLRAGAAGYLLKTTSAERLPYAIRGVTEGRAALPRDLVAKVLAEFRDRGRRRLVPVSGGGEPVELTAREYEVLAHLRRGEPTSAIAHHLRISEVTVRRHISAVEHKLGVHDRRGVIELLSRSEEPDPQDGASA